MPRRCVYHRYQLCQVQSLIIRSSGASSDGAGSCTCSDTTALFDVTQDACICLDSLAYFDTTSETCLCPDTAPSNGAKCDTSLYVSPAQLAEDNCLASAPYKNYNAITGICSCDDPTWENCQCFGGRILLSFVQFVLFCCFANHMSSSFHNI